MAIIKAVKHKMRISILLIFSERMLINFFDFINWPPKFSSNVLIIFMMIKGTLHRTKALFKTCFRPVLSQISENQPIDPIGNTAK